MPNENLAIWVSNQATDPAYTKTFTRAGGFSGSAINSTYQFRRATEQFGPAGKGWGWDVEEDRYVPCGVQVLHVLRIRFWWKDSEGVHSFPVFGQTFLLSETKSGLRADEEAPKKSLTDALTKALSMLGFSSDVYLGLFDDNKYINAAVVESAGKDIVRAPAPVKKLDDVGVDHKLVTAVRGLLARPDARDAVNRQYAIAIKKAADENVIDLGDMPAGPFSDPIDGANAMFELRRRKNKVVPSAT